MSASYAYETNNLADTGLESPGPDAETLDWSDKRLAKITRLRLLSDFDCPFWDVSYCWGELADGTTVRVRVPFWQLGKRTWKTEIINEARHAGVYAKGLGLFDAVSMIS
jgi:hypothetical protein